jgi:predicted 3-demethylubiquinone-9 3-methyltransferase (glyoxalase superfamily)
MTKSIYPCIWFDGNAKEAASFYCSVFNNSKITVDTPMVVNFELADQKFMGLNGGPHFKPNPSVSFFMVCETEKEVAEAWEKLSEKGSVLMPLDKYEWSEKYGWLQDRFGISWQLSVGKLEDVGQKLTPALMFTQNHAGKAEEAIRFYTSVFRDSSVKGILKYTAEDQDVEGTVKHAQFRLGNNVFMAMDSSVPHAFAFNEGISLVVECENQEEIDYFWTKLTERGEESRCGWLKDQYGVSWQIIPAILGNLMSDPVKAEQVMGEIMKMDKLNIDQLVKAYELG